MTLIKRVILLFLIAAAIYFVCQRWSATALSSSSSSSVRRLTAPRRKRRVRQSILGAHTTEVGPLGRPIHTDKGVKVMFIVDIGKLVVGELFTWLQGQVKAAAPDDLKGIANGAAGWLLGQVTGFIFPTVPAPDKLAIISNQLVKIQDTLNTIVSQLGQIQKQLEQIEAYAKYALVRTEVKGSFKTIRDERDHYFLYLEKLKEGVTIDRSELLEWRRKVLRDVFSAMRDIAAAIEPGISDPIEGRLPLFGTYNQVVLSKNPRPGQVWRQAEVELMSSFYLEVEEIQIAGVTLLNEAAHLPTTELKTEEEKAKFIADSTKIAVLNLHQAAGIPAEHKGGPTGLFTQRERFLPRVFPLPATFQYFIHHPSNLVWAMLYATIDDLPSDKPYPAGHADRLYQDVLSRVKKEYDGMGGWRLPTTTEMTWLFHNVGAAPPLNFFEDRRTCGGTQNMREVWTKLFGMRYKATAFLPIAPKQIGTVQAPPDARWSFFVDAKPNRYEGPVLYRSDVHSMWPYPLALYPQPIPGLPNTARPRTSPLPKATDIAPAPRTYSIMMVRTYHTGRRKPEYPAIDVKEGDILTCVDSPKISYLFENGQKRLLLREADREALKGRRVVSETCAVIGQIEEGPPIYKGGFTCE